MTRNCNICPLPVAQSFPDNLADSTHRLHGATALHSSEGRASEGLKRGTGTMAGQKVEDRALGLLTAFERAGRSVSRVIIEGRRIELELETGQDSDEFERIDMRHGKA